MTPEVRVDCPDEAKFDLVAALVERFKKTNRVIDVDGARIDFEDGWGLVRASNTQPALVFRFEAKKGKYQPYLTMESILSALEEKGKIFQNPPNHKRDFFKQLNKNNIELLIGYYRWRTLLEELSLIEQQFLLAPHVPAFASPAAVRLPRWPQLRASPSLLLSYWA